MNSTGDPRNPALDGSLSKWRAELDNVVGSLKLQSPVSRQMNSPSTHRSPPLRSPHSPAMDSHSHMPAFNPTLIRSPSQANRQRLALELEDVSEIVKNEVARSNEALSYANQVLRSRVMETEEEHRCTKRDVEKLAETVAELQRRTAAAEKDRGSRDETVVKVEREFATVGKWKAEIEQTVEKFKREWKMQQREFADLQKRNSDMMTTEDGLNKINELFAPFEAELRQRLAAQSKMVEEMSEAAQVSKSLFSRLNVAPQERESGESSESDLGLVTEGLRQEVAQKLEMFELRLSEKIASVDNALAWRLIEETKELDRKLSNHSLVVANELHYRDAPNFLQRLQSLEDEARKRRFTEVDYISKSQIRDRVDELLAQANLAGVVIPENETKFVVKDTLQEEVLQILRQNGKAPGAAQDKLCERLKSLEDKVLALETRQEGNDRVAVFLDEFQALKDVVSSREEDFTTQHKMNEELESGLKSLKGVVTASDAKVVEIEANIKVELEKLDALRGSAAKSAQVRDYKLAGLEERVSRLQRNVANFTSTRGQPRPSEAPINPPGMSVNIAQNRTKKPSDESSLSTPKSKSKEQLEKEARRQAELQAVRERLEKFEKKWSEGKVKGSRGKPGVQSPRSTAVKPAPPKSLPIPVSAPPANRPQEKKKDSSISCQYCRRLLPGKNTAALHESMCEKKPVECKYCQATVLRAELREHEMECSQKMSTCKYCDEEVKTHLLAKHESSCDWIPGSCSICGKVIIARDLKKHETMCRRRHESKDINKWSFEEVAEWVEGIAPDCAHSFRDFKVDGTMLADLKEGDLFAVLSINKEESRKALIEGFAALQREQKSN